MYERTRGLLRYSQLILGIVCAIAIGCGSDAAQGGGAGAGGAAGAAAVSGVGGVGGVGGQTVSRGGNGGTGGASAGVGGVGGTAGGGTAGAGGSSTPPPVMGETLRARDGALYDSCGEKVVLRGINHPTLYVDRSGKALPEIAKTGANAVRLFWYATRNVKISEAEPAIAASIENGMLPILEMHDSTCMWALDSIVSYWTSPQAIALIQKYERQLIVNIANETNPPNENEFRTKYSSVVKTMRSAGIHTPLMIDGGNCGRDYSLLLSQGQALVDADPDHNLIFSAHLYDRMSAAGYAKLFSDATSKKLTLVVGEFANKTPPGCGAALDYSALITAANDSGTGWLAWSWGDDDPNTDWNSDCGEFDMATTFSASTLRGWGKEVSMTLPASIQKTAVRTKSMRNHGACQ